MWRSGLRYRDAVSGSPEPFKGVESTRFRAEDVHDEVEVVEQNPASAIPAFDVRGLYAFGSERFLDGVRDGLNLPRVLPRHDDEVVGEALGRAKIEHYDIACFAILGRVDGALDLRGEFLRCAFA